MSTPVALPADLGVYLTGDPTGVDTVRATQSLLLAQNLCETIWPTLDATALGTVLAVAARQYNNVTSAHAVGIGSANISYGSMNTNMGIGGLYLSRSDKATLRRLAGRSGAFSIDLLPPAVPPTTVPSISTATPSGAAAGVLVTIIGLAFTGTTTVTFGGVAASFTVPSDSEVVAIVPAGAAGTVSIVVTNAIGASAPFAYVRS